MNATDDQQADAAEAQNFAAESGLALGRFRKKICYELPPHVSTRRMVLRDRVFRVIGFPVNCVKPLTGELAGAHWVKGVKRPPS